MQADYSVLFARIRRENRQQLIIALVHVALMIALMVFGKWLWMRVAVGLIGAVRVVAAYTIWNHDRRIAALSSLPKEAAGPKLLDVQLRFVKSVKYWYSWPLTLGLTLAAFAFWQNAHSWIGLLACAVSAVMLLLGTHQINDIRWVNELEAMQRREQ